MDSSFTLYALIIAAIVAGFLVVKKVASCLVKAVILLAIVAAIGLYYYVSTT